MTRKISIRLPEELLEEIDAVARVEETDRTSLLKRALLEFVEREREEEAFKERVVRLYLADRLDDAELDRLLGREEAEAVRAARRLLDKGERLAQALA